MENKFNLPILVCFLVLSLGLLAAPLFAQICDDPFEDMLELTIVGPSGAEVTHAVHFNGVSYDTENCTSTWSYCVKNNGSPEISHYVIGGLGDFLECLGEGDLVDPVISTEECPGEIACDPDSNTGICGIKFDCAVSDCDCFSFTLSGIYDVGEVYFGIKAGTQSQIGLIAGPSCTTAPLTCDDGDACTIDDVLDEDCNCAGTYVDNDNDGICAAEDCDDENPQAGSTENDMDCDGVPTEEDCDDNDPTITSTLPDCCGTDFTPDCDGDGIPDEAEEDCDEDGIPDDCEEDRNGNGTPDECEPDCDGDGIPDSAEMDCDGNGIPNDCELNDCDEDGLPDECEPDCDQDGIPNDCEEDCDGDGIPDDCEEDCDGNGIPDDCEGAADCDGDGIPDDQEEDSDGNGIPDDCEAECVLDCDDCKVESGFGSEITISFCCVSITIDNWVPKEGEPGEYVGFEIVAASVDGEPIDPEEVDFIVKAGGECYEGSGPYWLNPNGTSGPTAKAISHITLCENTDLCGIEPFFCDESCPGFNPGSEDQQFLELAPNPADNQINAKYHLYDDQEVSIEVIDINGQIFHSQSEMGQAGNNMVILNIQDLPSGMFLILIRTATGVRSERFIKATE